MVEARAVAPLVLEAVDGRAGALLRSARERAPAVRVARALALAVRLRAEQRPGVRVAEARPALRHVERIARAREAPRAVPAELRAAARAIDHRDQPTGGVVAEREERRAGRSTRALLERRHAERASDLAARVADPRVGIAAPVARDEEAAGAVLVDQAALRLHARRVELHPVRAGHGGAARETRHREARARIVHEDRAVVLRLEAPAPAPARRVIDGAERLAAESRVEHQVRAPDQEVPAGHVHQATRHRDQVELAPLDEAGARRERGIRGRTAEEQLREGEERCCGAARGDTCHDELRSGRGEGAHVRSARRVPARSAAQNATKRGPAPPARGEAHALRADTPWPPRHAALRTPLLGGGLRERRGPEVGAPDQAFGS